MLAYVGSGTLHLDEGRRLGRAPLSGFFPRWLELHRTLAEAHRAGEIALRRPADLRLRIPLRDLRVVEALPRWPALEVCWRAGAGLRREVFAPPGRVFGATLPSHAARHAAVVQALFRDLAGRSLRVRLAPGWTAHPDVPWQPVAGLPQTRTLSASSYRQPADGPVLARRNARCFAAFRDWLASSPARPFDLMAQEVALTSTHVYARFPDGRAGRLPRATLRARLGGVHEDATYVFGARTHLALGWRRGGCPVRAAFDRQLERASSSAPVRVRARRPRRPSLANFQNGVTAIPR
ncbi:MAG: hypothetical protein AAF447_22630 [Myxococcota bacterium]